jgi:cobalt-zinc-cadmium resistance protein CzcA
MRFNELVGGAATDVALAVIGDDLARCGRWRAPPRRRWRPPRASRTCGSWRRPRSAWSTCARRRRHRGRVGLGPGDVLDAVAALRIGLPAGVSQVGPRVIPIVVRLGATTPTDADLGRTLVPSPAGVAVPLDELAALARHDTPGLLAHEGGKRRLVVGFNVRGRDLGRRWPTRAPRRRRRADRASAWSGAASTRPSTEAKERLALVVPAVIALILVVLGLTFGARPARR